VAEEMEFFGQGQGLVVLAAQFHGGQYGQGEDGAGGHLGLGVIFVPQGLEGVSKVALRADL